MPIYEYRCEGCGHALETIQKVSDAPLTECPACHRPTLKKLISAAGFQLKGSGWYATDFKNGSKKSGSGNDGNAGGSGGTDSKSHGCGGGTCGCAH